MISIVSETFHTNKTGNNQYSNKTDLTLSGLYPSIAETSM